MPVVGRPFAAAEDLPGGNPPRAWSSDRICRLGAIATTVLLLYGGLLPFNLRRPDPLHPIAWLEQVRFTPWALAPTTDRAVNAVLGIPLGFFFMGVVRTGRGKRLSPGLALLVVVCASATLGASVELLQVLLPGRLSSWNDVVGQLLGVGVGTLGWDVAGMAIIQWLRDLPTEREALRLATRVLQLYLPIFVLGQLVPSELGLLRDFAGGVLLSIPIGALGVLALGQERHQPPCLARCAAGDVDRCRSGDRARPFVVQSPGRDRRGGRWARSGNRYRDDSRVERSARSARRQPISTSYSGCCSQRFGRS